MGAGPKKRDILCVPGISGSRAGLEHRIHACKVRVYLDFKVKKDFFCLKCTDRGPTR